ncbi:MAG: VWA domain-containing protein [Oscillospiraceae bacterium]
MKKRVWIVCAIILAVAMITGCSARDSGAMSSSAGLTAARTGEASAAESSVERAEEAPTGDYSADGEADAAYSTEAGPESGEAEHDAAVEQGEASMQKPQPQPEAGTLTAGEWNDNQNYSFLLNLMDGHSEWKNFSNYWKINLERRVAVTVTSSNGQPIANVKVELLTATEKVLWEACTDNNGVAYLFDGIALQSGRQPVAIQASLGSLVNTIPYNGEAECEIVLGKAPKASEPSLDIMFMIDTTGSMGDELEYLKLELEDVIGQVRTQNANIPVRLSVGVYRDVEDDYIVRSTPFETSISTPVKFLQKQSANGGGDFEEAVEDALNDAIHEHDWNSEATARLLFLVLDAPPHNTTQNLEYVPQLMADAAAQGIRIIPIASSGIDKNTEFLLRSMSVTTGGSYVFLTDHSGVGNSHLEPTIGSYEVEYLNDLLVRLIDQYLE